MSKLINKMLLAAVAVVAAPSSAYAADAFASFNGTQGAGGFFYGETSNPNVGFQGFTANTNCFISGSTCLQRAANGDVPGFTKSTTPSFQYGTVNVPADRLLIHPAQDGSILTALYRTPTAGSYNIRGTYTIQDISPTGVNVGFVAAPGGAVSNTALGQIGAGNTSGSFFTTLFLNAGDLVGFTFDNAGNYSNDSVGFNFTVVSSVPEPASWAMMIAGVGIAGGALRRRRSVKTTVSFA